MEIYTILSGIGAGVAFSLTGWAKAKGEGFDAVKFGKTIVVGAVSGLLLSLANVPYDATLTFLEAGGLTIGIENLLKALYRRLGL